MHTVQEEDELAESKVVLLPRPGLPPGLRRGHVELHVLDLPMNPAIGQVVGLITGDLPKFDEGPPHCCGASEGSPLTEPPSGDLFRTQHPRPRTPSSQSSSRRISSPLQP